MRRAVIGLSLLVCLAGSSAFADTVVQYTVNGTFGSDVTSAPLSGPNGTYSISFTLPQNPTPDYFDTTAGDFSVSNVPITYSFQCQGCATSTSFSGNTFYVNFAGTSLGGMFVVDFATPGPSVNEYYFQFGGPTLFSGPVTDPTLLAGGPFTLANAGYFLLDDGEYENLGSATVTATTEGVATPEPSTFALLLAAMAALGAMVFLKTQRA